MSRISWTQYFINMAHNIALRSTCPKAQIGAVIVNGRNRIVGTGYNGAPSGMPHCLDAGCVEVNNHCIISIHAEVNAVLQAMTLTDIVGSTLYSTHKPCIECCKIIINSGISRVVYDLDYYDNRCEPLRIESQNEFLKLANVECKHWKEVDKSTVRMH